MSKEDEYRIKPGAAVKMADLPTKVNAKDDERDAGKAELAELQAEIGDWSSKLYAENKHSLLVVVQGLDASGKDGVIKDVFTAVHPIGLVVTSFKVPTTEELAHDYLWRIHRAVPPRRMIGVWNRSHYEDVLVVRVDQLVADTVWRQRFDQINAFEKLLTENGVVVLKFFLNVSKDEQRERLQDRVDDPDKRWKFSMDDLRKRGQWGDYQAAYDDVLERCSTEWAPWHAIPADQNWYRNLAVARVIADALRRLNPSFPAGEPDALGLQIA